MDLKEYLQANYSPTATKGYQNLIKRYLLTMGKRADKASYGDIVSYIGLLRSQELHPKSLRNNLFAIKIYYSFLIKTGKRNDHPCKHLNLKDKINKQIHIESLYNKQTLEALYTHWQSNTSRYQYRDKVIISLLVCQGLTVQEIIKLKTSDIDLDKGTIHIQSSNKNKGRILSLRSNQILLFINYQQDRKADNTDAFLVNKYGKSFYVGAINRIVNQGRDIKDKLLPLKIRQSVIAHLLKEGKDIRIVQEFAGHRKTGSTENYKQSGLDQLKSVIDKLHPLQ